MNLARHRLSPPLYEGLPWVYLMGGVLALIASYAQKTTGLSLLLGLPGLVALMAGVVVLLRRRSYRVMRSEYAAPDALEEATASFRLPAAMPDRVPRENL